MKLVLALIVAMLLTCGEQAHARGSHFTSSHRSHSSHWPSAGAHVRRF